MNKATNFLKHADWDAEGLLEVGEEINDFTILECCLYYKSLGFQPTPEMRAFTAWHMAMYPELLADNHPGKTLLSGVEWAAWRNEPRDERVARGRELLALATLQAVRR